MIELETLLGAYATPDAPGASVLVRRHGEIIASHAMGLADADARMPATAATNYRLASVTKQFTAAAVLLLAQDGTIDLDEPISLFFDGLPPWGARTTVRHLLTHTAGLLDYEDLIPQGRAKPLDDADVLELLRAQKLMSSDPGISYRYSNSGYALLALIVEQASGAPFHQFLETRVFRPIGMAGSVAFVEGKNDIAHRAFGHRHTVSGWVRADQSLTSAVLGDGGVYSSVEDLARWDAELERPTVLDAGMLRQAFTPAAATDVAGISYGFGWKIGELAGRRMLFHTGWTTGFRNVLLRVPDERLTVAILTNRDEGQPFDAAREIGRRFLNRQR